MKYTTKRCPYCNNIYDHHSSMFAEYNWGSPIIKCNKCGKLFEDDEMIELAALPYDETKYVTLKNLKGFFNIFTVCFILMTFLLITDPSMRAPFTIGLEIISGLVTLHCIRSVTVDKHKYVEQYKRAYNESYQRLSNPNYAKQLKSMGYGIPEEFLK